VRHLIYGAFCSKRVTGSVREAPTIRSSSGIRGIQGIYLLLSANQRCSTSHSLFGSFNQVFLTQVCWFYRRAAQPKLTDWCRSRSAPFCSRG
jgi:hypothetical protein